MMETNVLGGIKLEAVDIRMEDSKRKYGNKKALIRRGKETRGAKGEVNN